MSKHPFALALGAAAAVAACAPLTPTLRSNHYKLTVPADWQVVEQSVGGNAPTVLRVPAGTGKRDDDGLELRLYAWSAFPSDADPVDEAVAHLTDRGGEAMQREAATETGCGGAAPEISLFGQTHKTVHLKSRSGHHLVVTAGQATGSLVAVVGYIRDQPAVFCKNILALESAMAVLRQNLRPGVDPNRVPVVRPLLVTVTNTAMEAPPAPDPTGAQGDRLGDR